MRMERICRPAVGNGTFRAAMPGTRLSLSMLWRKSWSLSKRTGDSSIKASVTLQLIALQGTREGMLAGHDLNDFHSLSLRIEAKRCWRMKNGLKRVP